MATRLTAPSAIFFVRRDRQERLLSGQQQRRASITEVPLRA